MVSDFKDPEIPPDTKRSACRLNSGNNVILIIETATAK
jgi:hypothetical protein